MVLKFDLVESERASGQISGVDYGSSVRVLLRSPALVVFSGSGGLHGFVRPTGRPHFQDHNRLAVGRLSNELIDAAQARLDELAGTGATIAVKAAWKAKKTALVDGGGDALTLPQHEARTLYNRRKAEASCNWKADLSGRIRTCVQCGNNLRPDVDSHTLSRTIADGHPRTVAECQRLSNHEVVAIYGFDHEPRWQYVELYHTWDGVSTIEEHFCSNDCAITYAHRAVAELPLLKPRGEAPVRLTRDDASTYHSEPEEEHGVVLPGGTLRL